MRLYRLLKYLKKRRNSAGYIRKRRRNVKLENAGKSRPLIKSNASAWLRRKSNRKRKPV